MTVSEQWVPVPGGEVRVRRHHLGGAQAVPVLFVHGAFVNSHLWDGVIDHLVVSGASLDLIAPDLPLGAHHRRMNAGTDLTVSGITSMLIGVLDALELDQVVVVANDSGGAITQHMLVSHPARFSGVLLTSTEAADNFPPQYFRFLFPPLRLRAFMWSTGHLLRTNVGRRLPITFGHLFKRRLTSEQARTLMGPLWESPGARNDVRLFLISATDDPDLLTRAEARFDQVTAPVDIAWTAGDRVFPDRDADRLADRFPRGRRVGDITDSGSLSPFDQPEQVAQRVLGLLARTTAEQQA
jgi:pimeloyl-ACP methyl ester carboxylesterase